MSTDNENIKQYVESLQAQIIEILNKVKEETGIDLPVDVTVRSTEDASE